MERRRELLSEEEIRGLLGEDGGEAEAAGMARSAAGARRVLLVTRGEDDVRLLRGVLGGLDYEVVEVRNPFAALDQLRLRRYAGVISDFELWADGGKLLFERLERAGAPIPVVFTCSSDEASGRARLAPAAEVLQRPLDPARLERAARAFGSQGSQPAAAPRPERAPAAAERGGDGPAPSLEAEVAWLRFFFEARAALRTAPGVPERLWAVLGAFERQVGAPCGAAVALPQGLTFQVHPAARRLLEALAAALDGGAGAPARRPSEAAATAGMIIVPASSAGGRPAVFGALHPIGWTAGVPEKFLEELAALLGEAVSS